MAKLKPHIRTAYVRQLAKVIAADGRLDADELVKLYGVCALLDVPDAERMALVETLAYDMGALEDEVLPPALLKNDELRMALAKDTLFFETGNTLDATRRVARTVIDELRL